MFEYGADSARCPVLEGPESDLPITRTNENVLVPNPCLHDFSEGRNCHLRHLAKFVGGRAGLGPRAAVTELPRYVATTQAKMANIRQVFAPLNLLLETLMFATRHIIELMKDFNIQKIDLSVCRIGNRLF